MARLHAEMNRVPKLKLVGVVLGVVVLTAPWWSWLVTPPTCQDGPCSWTQEDVWIVLGSIAGGPYGPIIVAIAAASVVLLLGVFVLRVLRRP